MKGFKEFEISEDNIVVRQAKKILYLEAILEDKDKQIEVLEKALELACEDLLKPKQGR